jgi:Nitrile hydratase beta subunit
MSYAYMLRSALRRNRTRRAAAKKQAFPIRITVVPRTPACRPGPLSLSYYQRWMRSIAGILVRKGVVTEAELRAALEQG